jgi:hypothetical protein
MLIKGEVPEEIPVQTKNEEILLVVELGRSESDRRPLARRSFDVVHYQL